MAAAEAYAAEGDRLRDIGSYAVAAEAYGQALDCCRRASVSAFSMATC